MMEEEKLLSEKEQENIKKFLPKKEQEEIKQIMIEAQDERNITLGNMAKARAYELMMYLYAITIAILVFLKMISVPVFLILLTVFVVCQGYFIFWLRKYHKEN